MRVDGTGKLSAKEIVDGKGRSFLQMEDFARHAIGVNHIPASLHKDVARQGFQERPLLGREYRNFSF